MLWSGYFHDVMNSWVNENLYFLTQIHANIRRLMFYVVCHSMLITVVVVWCWNSILMPKEKIPTKNLSEQTAIIIMKEIYHFHLLNRSPCYSITSSTLYSRYLWTFFLLLLSFQMMKTKMYSYFACEYSKNTAIQCVFFFLVLSRFMFLCRFSFCFIIFYGF